MSSRWEKWERIETDYSRPPYFADKVVPHGTLPKADVVLQWSDHWFSEIDDCWKPVTGDHVGKWGDEVFGSHVTLYGFLPRFSDAIHPERFPAKHGREKPPVLSEWPDGRGGRSDLAEDDMREEGGL